jgi:hypothetical protein
VVRHGEAASTNKAGAEKFKTKFAEFMEQEGYLYQHVFNVDETALFWKMPRRTYIIKLLCQAISP